MRIVMKSQCDPTTCLPCVPIELSHAAMSVPSASQVIHLYAPPGATMTDAPVKSGWPLSTRYGVSVTLVTL